MAKQKKNIARLVLQGISVLGILFGCIFFFCGFVMIISIQRGNFANIFGSLIFSGALLALGAFLVYPSYLMLRGRSFNVLKSIAALVALIFSGLVYTLDEVYTNTLDRGKMSRFIEDIAGFASLIVFVLVFALVYKISIKLLERLKEAAHSPEKIPDTQHSTDKQ
jgi:hypothetical protein